MHSFFDTLTFFRCTTPLKANLLAQISQVHSLGKNAAEERDVQPEVLRQGVETAHASEVNQAVGGLLTVLNRNPSCGEGGGSQREALQQIAS